MPSVPGLGNRGCLSVLRTSHGEGKEDWVTGLPHPRTVRVMPLSLPRPVRPLGTRSAVVIFMVRWVQYNG